MTTNNHISNIQSFLASLAPGQSVTLDGDLFRVASLSQDLDSTRVDLVSHAKGRAYRLDPIGGNDSAPPVALRLQTSGGRGKPVSRLVSSVECG